MHVFFETLHAIVQARKYSFENPSKVLIATFQIRNNYIWCLNLKYYYSFRFKKILIEVVFYLKNKILRYEVVNCFKIQSSGSEPGLRRKAARTRVREGLVEQPLAFQGEHPQSNSCFKKIPLCFVIISTASILVNKLLVILMMQSQLSNLIFPLKLDVL